MTPTANLIFIDTETTGVNVFEHDVLAISFKPMRPEFDSLDVFIRYEEPLKWTEKAREYFEKYRTQWEEKALTPAVAVDKISKYFEAMPEGTMLVGHNVSFDQYFLKKLFDDQYKQVPNLSHRTVDTHSLMILMEVIGLQTPGTSDSQSAFEEYQIYVPEKMRHTSRGDVIATKQLLVSIAHRLDVLKTSGSEEVAAKSYLDPETLHHIATESAE